MNPQDFMILGVVVFLAILIVALLILRIRLKQRRANSVPLPIVEERVMYSLLVILTETSIETSVSIKGYGLFSYRDPLLYENLQPARSLTGASSDFSVTSPIVNIVSVAVREKTFQFFEAGDRPDLQADDTIPVCLTHNKILYMNNEKINPCPDTYGMRVRAGIVQKEHKTRPLAQDNPLFPLRQAIINDKKYSLL